MTTSSGSPAVFVLQAERDAVVANPRVAAYEERLGARFGLSREDVHVASAGTTTASGDSAED